MKNKEIAAIVLSCILGVSLCFIPYAIHKHKSSMLEESAQLALERPPQKTNGGSKAKSSKKLMIDTLRLDDVIVRINGDDVTRRDFVAWENALCSMFAVSRGWKASTSNAETERFKSSNKVNVLQSIVKHVLTRQYASKHGIQASQADIDIYAKNFLELVKKPKSKLEDAVKSFNASDADMISKILHGDALTRAVLVSTSSNSIYSVTDAEFSNRVEYVKHMNAAADASNDVARAKAFQVKKELMSGTNFQEVASRYAETFEEDVISSEDMDMNDPLSQWLMKASPGDISDPLELDYSISIVKLVNKTADDNESSYSYEVMRCAFRLYERYDDFGNDRTLIEADMIALREAAAMDNLRTMLLSSAKIEFPNGDSLFMPLKQHKQKKRLAKKLAKPAKHKQ